MSVDQGRGWNILRRTWQECARQRKELEHGDQRHILGRAMLPRKQGALSSDTQAIRTEE